MTVMKLILMLAGGLLAWPFLSSCSDYSSGYGYSSGYSSGGYSSGGYGSSGYGYSTSYAPLQVGFISTTYDRWSYDPYRRCYYDRSLRRYYNYGSRSYYSSPPRRYSTAYYPTGYRRGHQLSCPTYLPRHHYGSLGSHGSQHVGNSHDDGGRNSHYQGGNSHDRRSSNYRTTPAPTIIRNSSSDYDRQRQARDEAARRSRDSQMERQRVAPTRVETIRTPSRPQPQVRTQAPRVEAPQIQPQRMQPPRQQAPRIQPSAPSRPSPPSRSTSGPSSRGGGVARESVR